MSTILDLKTLDSDFSQKFSSYLELVDEDIVKHAQIGDSLASEFLLYKYRNLVKAKVKSYFLVGAEKEDLIQVGMIGLWQAIIDFRQDKAISFPAFAKLCIQRHIITAIKTANRQKQIPLNTSLSLEAPVESQVIFEWSLLDILSTTSVTDPEELVIRQEDAKLFHQILRRLLSDFEWKVLTGYRSGKSYRDISSELRCNTKSVDNAISRIKRKVAGICGDNWNMGDFLASER